MHAVGLLSTLVRETELSVAFVCSNLPTQLLTTQMTFTSCNSHTQGASTAIVIDPTGNHVNVYTADELAALSSTARAAAGASVELNEFQQAADAENLKLQAATQQCGPKNYRNFSMVSGRAHIGMKMIYIGS